MQVPDILSHIVKVRRKRVEAAKKIRTIQELKACGMNKTPPSFFKAIKKEGLSVIAEMKKASPSKGIIRNDFQPVQIAKQYEKAADAISVLTEEDFFMGSPNDLIEVGETVILPLLQKDFIMDAYQIYEAKAWGASCVLLIASILEIERLAKLISISKSIGLDALVEIHDREELNRALCAGANMIGINNRNLHTFHVDFSTTLMLAPMVPDGVLVVSESGIQKPEDLIKLQAVRIDAILVGECLMRSRHTEDLIRELKKA